MKPGVRSLILDRDFLEDLAHWISTDRKTALRILERVEAIRRDPADGLGKSESPRHLGPAFGPGASPRNIAWSIEFKTTAFSSHKPGITTDRQHSLPQIL